MKPAALALFIACALVGCAATVGLFIAARPPTPIQPGDFSQLVFQPHPGAPLPLAARLADETGHEVALGTYFTRLPVILVLDFLRCTSLCGISLRNLVDTLNRLPLQPGRDYQLLAISIDPRDTPADAEAARAKYAALFRQERAESGLHFMTGAAGVVAAIADRVGFPYRYDSLADAYIHPAGFVIATPGGVISRYVEGIAASPSELAGALADAELDKSQGPLTRLLLLCHAKGVPLGRFTVPVLTAFTIADIAAAIILIAWFAALRRRRYG